MNATIERLESLDKRDKEKRVIAKYKAMHEHLGGALYQVRQFHPEELGDYGHGSLICESLKVLDAHVASIMHAMQFYIEQVETGHYEDVGI